MVAVWGSGGRGLLHEGRVVGSQPAALHGVVLHGLGQASAQDVDALAQAAAAVAVLVAQGCALGLVGQLVAQEDRGVAAGEDGVVSSPGDQGAQVPGGTAVVGGLILGGLISVGLYAYLTPPAAPPPAPAERRVLFWYDPMKPDVKFDQPGKSPFMDMDLVAKYADEGEPQDADQGVRIDPAQQQNLGLKTAKVRQGRLTNVSVLPANIRFNEYQYVIMQARAEGFVEKVYPLTNGDRITRGSPLVDITIPAWVEAQSEYLLLMPGAGQEAQRQGVLERLRLSGMPEADIQRLRTTRRIQTRFTLRAPLDGVITAFDLRAGMNFSKDKVVAQI